MSSTNIRDLQLALLEILHSVDELCAKNGIEYFIDSGTLLGAVRHKGFIPWDDDIDIGMTRINYDKFLKIARAKLKDEYVIRDWNSDVNYCNPFAKIYKKNTTFIEKHGPFVERHEGIFIDVLPYDNAPADLKKQKKMSRQLTLLRRLIFIKCGQYNTYSLPIRYFAKVASLFINKSVVIKKYNMVAQKYNKKNTGLMFEHTGNAKLCTWIIPSEALSSFTPLLFEGQYYNAPTNWDMYLRSVYGNYMCLPPKEKQVAMHVIEFEV